MPALIAVLPGRRYSECHLNKILEGNHLRVIRDVTGEWGEIFVLPRRRLQRTHEVIAFLGIWLLFMILRSMDSNRANESPLKGRVRGDYRSRCTWQSYCGSAA